MTWGVYISSFVWFEALECYTMLQVYYDTLRLCINGKLRVNYNNLYALFHIGSFSSWVSPLI
jgi:hypothetical protein